MILFIRLQNNMIDLNNFILQYKTLFIGFNKEERDLFKKITNMSMKDILQVHNNLSNKLTLKKKGNDKNE